MTIEPNASSTMSNTWIGELAQRSRRLPDAVRPGSGATFVEAVKELRPTGTHRGDPGHGDDQPAHDHITYSNPTSRSECTAEEAYRRRKRAAAGEHGAALATGDLFGDCLRSDDEHGVATNALGNIVIYAPHRSPVRKHDLPNATAP